jgi:hypothetical protein
MHWSLGRLAGTLGVTAVVLLGVVGAATAHDGRAAERLYLTTDSGVTVIDPHSGDTNLSLPDALPTGDWSAVVRASVERPDATVVEAVDPETGAVLRSQRFDGALSVRAVSRTGDLVALMAREPRRGLGGLYRAARRERTTLTLTRLDGAPPRTLAVDANIEPEAFSSDRDALFVIEYSPPLDPDRYRVARLDLASAQIGDVYTTEKELQGPMRGTARMQVLAPDGSRLYTLYTKANREAFVHVLSLDDQVANCVDLPKGFGSVPEAMAITTSPDGTRVIVVDAAAGRAAELDAARLQVQRTRPVRGVEPSRHVTTAATANQVFVASGRTVLALREPTLERSRHWAADTPVQALHVGDDGTLFVAERSQISALDPRSSVRRSFDVTARGKIRGVADGLPATAKSTVQCAC